jgi:hypothetical protein
VNESVQRILDSGYSRATKIAAAVRIFAGVKPALTYEEVEVVIRQLAAERAEGMRAVAAMLHDRSRVMHDRGFRYASMELESAARSIEQKADRL